MLVLRDIPKKIKRKKYKWKRCYIERTVCRDCETRKRVSYRCSRCNSSTCSTHSTLTCKDCTKICRQYPQPKKYRSCKRLPWKLRNNNRKRCNYCSSRNKVPFQCSICGLGICDNHSSLHCSFCNDLFE